MQEEGVIKFDLRHTDGDPVSLIPYEQLNRWRSLLWNRALIGQDPARYGGYGFGNVSQRTASSRNIEGQRSFLVSGSQTGGLEILQAEHYAVVTAYDAASNRIGSQGPVRPSSESLIHGMLYDQSDDIRVVLHVHSPEIWRAAELSLPVTDAAVAYGTPAMAREVERLFRDTDVTRRKIFSMAGHEDGIIAFGATAGEAGTILLDTLSASRNTNQ